MIISQISVFVENRPGTLAEVLGVLKEHAINLRALSVADTADFGILRMIVNDPAKVEVILRGAGYAVKSTPVLTMTVADTPGGVNDQIERSCGVSTPTIIQPALSRTVTSGLLFRSSSAAATVG